ncbi:MAG: type II secretion system protein [Aquabacterium sp.]|nr:MAG: type II secretion system protein [Aquabacterium sp.]
MCRTGPARGFTLIEMLVVVLIVGILASAAMPLAELNQRRAREADLRTALRSIRTALDEYRADCLPAAQGGRGVIKCEDGVGRKTGYPPDLETLVKGAEDKSVVGSGSARAGTERRRYYLRRIPRDPFADASLPAAQTWGLRSYDSPPDAPAPGADVYDVYSMSDGIAMDGSHYRDW